MAAASTDRNLKIALAAGAGVVAAGLAYWFYSSWTSHKKDASNGVVKGQRVRTPFGYGIVDAAQPKTPTGLYRVHLPNATMGYLNAESVQFLAASEPVYVRTPFGLAELQAPQQTSADLKGVKAGSGDDKTELFTVKLPFAVAQVNSEAIRIANFEPYPSVETPDGPGRIVEPSQEGPQLKPNSQYQFVVALDSGATKTFDAKYVERMQRGHTLDA